VSELNESLNRKDADIKLDLGGKTKWLLLFTSPGKNGFNGQRVFGFKKIDENLNPVMVNDKKPGIIAKRFIEVLRILKKNGAGEIKCSDVYRTYNDYKNNRLRTDISFNKFDSIVVFGKDTQCPINNLLFSKKASKVKCIYYVTHLSPQNHELGQFEVFKPMKSNLEKEFANIWKKEKRGK
jgi:hypothetical protein